MFDSLSDLTDDETDRIGRKMLIALYTVGTPLLIYILAIARYGWLVTNLVGLVVVASFLPEANSIRKQLQRTHDPTVDDPPDEQPEDQDESIVAKHHWMMLAWPSIVLILSAIALLLHATVVDDQLKLAYTIMMVAAFGLMVGIPYYVMLMRFYRSFRQISRATLTMRIASLVGLMIFAIVIAYVLESKGVSFDWFVSLVTYLGNWLTDLVRLITASQLNVLLTIAILASVKWVAQYVNWRINPLELDGNLFTERSGIVRREPRSVRISEITDLKVTQFKLTDKKLRLPWVRLTVETAGQDQAMTNIHWVPQRMCDQLLNRWNEEKGA